MIFAVEEICYCLLRKIIQIHTMSVLNLILPLSIYFMCAHCYTQIYNDIQDMELSKQYNTNDTTKWTYLIQMKSEIDATQDSVQSIYSKRTTLRNWINGRHLRIATLEDFPLSYTQMLENGKRIGSGVSFEVIDFLQEKFNFTYEVVVPDANIIGSPNDFNLSLIKMLNNSEVDLAAAFLPLLSDQRSYIYFSTTTLDEGEWIMVMRRPRESATGSGLMAPFEFWVWILIVLSLLLVGPIIYFLIILRNKITKDSDQKPYSLGHCAWFVYGALMKQGSTLSPIADSTRLLFATWWIFITILTSFYTANLTAFLTLSKFTLPFNTVNDILYKNKHFVSIRGRGIEYAIRSENEDLSLLSGMIKSNHAVFSEERNDTSNLRTFVEEDGYVFVRDRPAINHALYIDYRYRKTISLDNEKIHCPFAMAKKPFLKKKRSFAYPIGSNLSELFDPELLNLVESGIIKHLSIRGLPNAEICPQDLGGTERQLRNGDLMMTYYIMAAGFITSIVVFTTEFIFRYINSRKANGLLAFESSPSFHRSNPHLGPNSNVTPPPPYQSIFSNNFKMHNENIPQHWKRKVVNGTKNVHGVNMIRSENRKYNPILTETMDELGVIQRFIKGRNYWIQQSINGQNQLVPVRIPSVATFQYTYTE